jgi:hypothetical protein
MFEHVKNGPVSPWSVALGKAVLSRRRFLRAAGGTIGALAAGSLWPTVAQAAGRSPKPMPGGFANPVGGPFIHLNPPGPADGKGLDPATITDFDGFVGNARIQGTGTGTNTDTGDTFPLLFDADMRFMQGLYQSVDGRFRQARLVEI